jgi:hypothetical protein
VDGYYVTLWRLMLRYPELLAWENLWHDTPITHQAVMAGTGSGLWFAILDSWTRSHSQSGLLERNA